MSRQSYLPGTAVLVTAWTEARSGEDIELADVMAWPERERPEGVQGQRVVIRRMRAPKDAEVRFELFPKLNFHGTPDESHPWENGARFGFGKDFLGLWTSFPFEMEPDGASAVFHMRGGEEHWVVLGWNTPPTGWSAAYAAQVFQEAANYWRGWSAELKVADAGTRSAALHRSALTVQLLSHAHHSGSVRRRDRREAPHFSWQHPAALLARRVCPRGDATQRSAPLCGRNIREK